jgi:hypothetical protein
MPRGTLESLSSAELDLVDGLRQIAEHPTQECLRALPIEEFAYLREPHRVLSSRFPT